MCKSLLVFHYLARGHSSYQSSAGEEVRKSLDVFLCVARQAACDGALQAGE